MSMRSEGQDIPRISVIMPLYNRAPVVRAAIDSVLVQRMGDFELLVVDDGSTDGGAEVVRAIGDARIRLVQLPENRGGNAARNEGIRQAKAGILTFLDSDDAFLPHRLESVAAAFDADPGLEGLIDSFRKTWPGSSRPPEDRLNPDLQGRDALLRALFHRHIWKSTPGVSATREAAIRAGLFDETLSRRQDFDFLIRLIRVAKVRSRSDVTWIKSDSVDGISADRGRYMKSFTQFWDRHPDYFADADFRGGFAADLSRHFGKLAKKGRLVQAAGDLGPVAQRIGWPATITTLFRGFAEQRKLKSKRTAIRR